MYALSAARDMLKYGHGHCQVQSFVCLWISTSCLQQNRSRQNRPVFVRSLSSAEACEAAIACTFTSFSLICCDKGYPRLCKLLLSAPNLVRHPAWVSGLLVVSEQSCPVLRGNIRRPMFCLTSHCSVYTYAAELYTCNKHLCWLEERCVRTKVWVG